MREKILKIVRNLRPDVDFEHEMKLIDEGVLDSFDIVSLVFELNDFFEVEIDVNELVPENFNSVEAMVELIREKID